MALLTSASSSISLTLSLGETKPAVKGQKEELRKKLTKAEERHKLRKTISTEKEKSIDSGSSSTEKCNTIRKDKSENRRIIGKVSTG